MAYTPKPDSYEVLIGEESIVKYYSDSKRTNLIKTVHRTNYVGWKKELGLSLIQA